MDTEESIADVTASCLSHFDECLGVDSLMVDEWAENRLADFNIWIYSMGATTRGRASLDSRLTSRRGTREIIIELLHLLDGLVCQCKDFGQDTGAPNSTLIPSDNRNVSEVDQSLEQEEQRSFSPWSDASETDDDHPSPELMGPGNPLLGKMKHIETILDQLARISVAIRRSGNHSRLQKADQRLNPDDHQILRDHLIVVLLRRSGDITELTEVQRRLIDANIRRRNRFIYAQTHAEHLAMAHDKSQSGHTVSQSTAQGYSEDPMQEESQTKSLSQSEVETTTTALAIGTPSILHTAQFEVPGATAKMSSPVVNIKYPRPPKLEKNAKLFKCPCCCQELQAEFAENDKWKKHLAGDIVPYTCVLPNCATPDVMFPTKDDWCRHLLGEHYSYEYWTCSICREGIELPDEESFVWHTKTQHAGSISQDHIPVLASLSRRSSPAGMNSCPICGWPQTEGAMADKESLIEHVAKEVHAFSLRSLPWVEEPEHAADNWTRENHENVFNWSREFGRTEEPSSLNLAGSFGKPLAEPVIPNVGYFQRNTYFAGSSSASSRKHTSAAALGHSKEDHQEITGGSLSFENRPSRPSTSSKNEQELPTTLDDACRPDPGQDFINSIKAVPKKRMKGLVESDDLETAQQEISDTRETSARTYIAESEGRTEDHKETGVDEESSASGSGVNVTGSSKTPADSLSIKSNPSRYSATSTGGGKSSRGQRAEIVTLWTCCYCNNAGNSNNDVACYNCHLPRCSNCVAYNTTVYPTRDRPTKGKGGF